MRYKCDYKDEFIVPVFTQESGYWGRATKYFLPTLMLSTLGLSRRIGRKHFPNVFQIHSMMTGRGLTILMSNPRAPHTLVMG